MIHAKGIDWQPIAALPNDRKDGREILVWETVVEGRIEVATWDPSGPAWRGVAHNLKNGVWCDREGATIHGITHWADINPPV